MHRFVKLPRPVLLTLAAVFSLAASLYSLAWMTYAQWETSAAPFTWLDRLSIEIMRSNPVWFLVIAVAVLFARLRHEQAWLLALVYGGAIAAPPLASVLEKGPPSLTGFMIVFRAAFFWLVPALFYAFFAVFPVRSPLDRRWPRLKWLLLVPGSLLSLSYAVSVFTGAFQSEWRWGLVETIYFLGAFALGLISLLGNYFNAAPGETRRKLRVILWGTTLGLPPTMLMLAAKVLWQFNPPLWLDAIPYLASYLLPVSFGYAVMVHHVLDFPTLLRRGARYLLVQRGFTGLLTVLSMLIAVFVATRISTYWQVATDSTFDPSVVAGVLLGGAMLGLGMQIQQRVRQKLDRAFFRSAYDTHQILQDLARMTRTVRNRQELAILLQNRISQALHPTDLTVYLQSNTGEMVANRGKILPELRTLPPDLPILSQLAHSVRPVDFPLTPQAAKAADSPLARLDPACLVPILSLDRNLVGLVVLGGRRSEEPYSGEDKNLLELVANQAGIALENLMLAEQMAERLDAERRAAYEMNIAREVQSKLLPQQRPAIEGLDYDGICVQSRAVGGDYFDFLIAAPGTIGLVLADVAGKGIHAALLMAHLQANFRSQYAVAGDDITGMLRAVNTLFYDSTEVNHYATFFLGEYTPATRRLRYTNCGHNPPLLLRKNGAPEWLHATGVALGLFRDWEPGVKELQLAAGDTLTIYSDGVPEAEDEKEDMFGEYRLVNAVKTHRNLPAASMAQKLVETVQAFSGPVQSDDLTVVVAHVL